MDPRPLPTLMPLRAFARLFPYRRHFATPRLDLLGHGTCLLNLLGNDRSLELVHYIVRPHDYALDAIAKNSGSVECYFPLSDHPFAAAGPTRFRVLLQHPNIWLIGLTNLRVV